MRTRIFFVLAMFSLLCVSPARAALIQYTYSGIVTSVENIVGNAQSNLAFVGQYGIVDGAVFTGSFVLDTGTPDIRPDLDNFGDYRRPTVETSIQIGSLVASNPGSTFTSDRITVADNTVDRWFYSLFIVPIAPGFGTSIFEVLLTDSSGTAFDSDALGPVPPLSAFDPYNPNALNGTEFVAAYSVPDGFVSVYGEITSFTRVVPLPPALLLLFSACSGLLVLARRKQG